MVAEANRRRLVKSGAIERTMENRRTHGTRGRKAGLHPWQRHVNYAHTLCSATVLIAPVVLLQKQCATLSCLSSGGHSKLSVCVFRVFCGSIFLTYCPRHLAAFAAWANEGYRPSPMPINPWVSSENLQAVLLDDRQ
jgi:hypothetical protein